MSEHILYRHPGVRTPRLPMCLEADWKESSRVHHEKNIHNNTRENNICRAYEIIDIAVFQLNPSTGARPYFPAVTSTECDPTSKEVWMETVTGARPSTLASTTIGFASPVLYWACTSMWRMRAKVSEGSAAAEVTCTAARTRP